MAYSNRINLIMSGVCQQILESTMIEYGMLEPAKENKKVKDGLSQNSLTRANAAAGRKGNKGR